MWVFFAALTEFFSLKAGRGLCGISQGTAFCAESCIIYVFCCIFFMLFRIIYYRKSKTVQKTVKNL